MGTQATAYVVMGVTGCGKSTVGRALAARLGCRFLDADDFHPPANREKLGRDIPLDDDDRRPWLRTLADLLARECADGATVVMACSALKESYRDVLRSSGCRIVFVHLAGTPERIAARLRLRAGHHGLVRDFDRILAGQFRDLEPPADAIPVDIGKSPDDAADEVLRAARGRQGAEPR